MREWVISVCVLVFLFSIIFLIVPKGKLGNYVNYVLSILLLVAIISPFFSMDFTQNFEGLNNESVVQIDTDYVSSIHQLRAEKHEENINEILLNENLYCKSIMIKYDENNLENFIILETKIILSKEVINLDNEHIDIIARATNIVSNYLNIDEGKIDVKIE